MFLKINSQNATTPAVSCQRAFVICRHYVWRRNSRLLFEKDQNDKVTFSNKAANSHLKLEYNLFQPRPPLVFKSERNNSENANLSTHFRREVTKWCLCHVTGLLSNSRNIRERSREGHHRFTVSPLLTRFAHNMDNLREGVMINQFVVIAGCHAEQARQFLTAAKWHFEASISARFFKTNVDHAAMAWSMLFTVSV